MPEERDRALLEFIQESIDLVHQYAAPGQLAFFTDRMMQDAILRRLETLADAANQLSDELKTRNPQLPWNDIYGFRNVAAHGYLTLDLRRVWATVESHLTPLKLVVETELARYPSDQ